MAVGEIQRVRIEIPPSANHLWRIIAPKKGRAFMGKTAEYKSWLEATGLQLRCELSKVKALPAAIRVEIRGGEGFPESRDLDNCLKPIGDAIRASGIIPNDRVSEVVEYTIKYIRGDRHNRVAECWIEIEELGESVQEPLFT